MKAVFGKMTYYTFKKRLQITSMEIWIWEQPLPMFELKFPHIQNKNLKKTGGSKLWALIRITWVVKTKMKVDVYL